MSALYPEIQPYDSGMLEVGDGNHVYWEVVGNPLGKPAVVFHGGPGSGASPGWRRYFNPERYRVVLFDQRNCGRSTPHASDPSIDLSANTLPHLIGDAETLRRYLGIDRWLVLGASWGSTLGLAYAERHPERVTEMVLFSIATTTSREIDWITNGVGAFFPEAWEQFRDAALAIDDEPLVDAYARLLMSPDPVIHEQAARDWCDWEMAIVDIHPDHKPSTRYDDPRFRLAFARLVTHYWAHRGWLEDNELLHNIGKIAEIPAALVHGRLDVTGPIVTAWNLHRNWPASRLIPVRGAGHDSRDPGMAESVVMALDEFSTT
ncbi:prolyl aminopeptidase [Paradevosia shaoguanensis]|uniref:prolyl aminopeptidase n=1 Tax=Paradevosia shaoguanensis TaxID=1335043 RepID=UPI003C76E9B8